MTMELSGFFPIPAEAHVALENLKAAEFDVDTAEIVTGEDARNKLHKRLAAARRGRAAAGALVSGMLSLILAAAVVAPAATFPWSFVLSFVILAGLIGAAIGGYYGMGVEQESILVGLAVPRNRIREAVRILRLAGGRLIMVRPLTAGPELPEGRRRPTMIMERNGQ